MANHKKQAVVAPKFMEVKVAKDFSYIEWRGDRFQRNDYVIIHFWYHGNPDKRLAKMAKNDMWEVTGRILDISDKYLQLDVSRQCCRKERAIFLTSIKRIRIHPFWRYYEFKDEELNPGTDYGWPKL